MAQVVVQNIQDSLLVCGGHVTATFTRDSVICTMSCFTEDKNHESYNVRFTCHAASSISKKHRVLAPLPDCNHIDKNSLVAQVTKLIQLGYIHTGTQLPHSWPSDCKRVYLPALRGNSPPPQSGLIPPQPLATRKRRWREI